MIYCLNTNLGFVQNLAQNMLLHYEKLLHNLDSGLTSCAIFLDLAKAFDSVSHEILLKKLNYYGIRGKALDLFKSYLYGRSQFVKVNDVCSSLTNIIFGVPQGSILGPLLFLLFINDLPDATKFYVKLFADDTFLCFQDKDFDILEHNVNIELNKVFTWLASNKLTLNISKSKYMVFSKKRTVPELKIYLNNIALERCNTYKYLGVFFDHKLDWKAHIEHISNKISRSCGALAKLRHCVDTKTLVNVYHALVNSYVRYGIIAWGSASNSALKPLQTLINKAIRIITFAPFGNIDLNPAYKQLNLLTIVKTYRLEIAKFTYKLKNNLLPTTLGNFFQFSSDQQTHNHFVRNRSRPVRFLSKCKTGEKTIQFNSFQLWKEIPLNIKSSLSYNIFKKSYKNYLLET